MLEMLSLRIMMKVDNDLTELIFGCVLWWRHKKPQRITQSNEGSGECDGREVVDA